MEAHADRLGSLDLGVEQVATVLRVEIQVIGAGGATTEREFGSGDEASVFLRVYQPGRNPIAPVEMTFSGEKFSRRGAS